MIMRSLDRLARSFTIPRNLKEREAKRGSRLGSPQLCVSRRAVRAHAGRCGTVVAAILSAAAAFTLVGCATPPSPIEIDEQYDRYGDDLEKALHRMLQACQSDPNPSECAANVINWYLQQLALLEQARQDAINENWKDAYERRRLWEEHFREMFPDWPEFEKLIEPLWMEAQVQFDLSTGSPGDPDACDEVVLMVNARRADFEGVNLEADPELLVIVQDSPCFEVVPAGAREAYAQALEGQTWPVDGTVSVEYAGDAMDADVTGSLGLVPSPVPSGSSGDAWAVVSGSLTVKTGGSTLLTMSVLTDATNRIEVDSRGAGTIRVLFGNEYSHEAWAAVLPYYNRVELPISLAPDGTFHIETGWIEAGDLVPYSPWPASDYNQDGVYEYISDLAAFMADFNAQEPLADQDINGVWNQNDIDLWTERFWEDYAATQP